MRQLSKLEMRQPPTFTSPALVDGVLFGPFRYPKANSLIGATQLSIMR